MCRLCQALISKLHSLASQTETKISSMSSYEIYHWFQVIIQDSCRPNQKYYFMYGGWIARDEGEGKLWREITAKKTIPKELKSGMSFFIVEFYECLVMWLIWIDVMIHDVFVTDVKIGMNLQCLECLCIKPRYFYSWWILSVFCQSVPISKDIVWK